MPPGRRWSVLLYFPQHEEVGELHRLTSTASTVRLLDPRFEYRHVFDAERQLWRLDVRRGTGEPTPPTLDQSGEADS